MNIVDDSANAVGTAESNPQTYQVRRAGRAGKPPCLPGGRARADASGRAMSRGFTGNAGQWQRRRRHDDHDQLPRTRFSMNRNLGLILAVAVAVAAAGALALASQARTAASSPRSGALHVTKECSAYTGLAGFFCTITSSNLKSIEDGSRVVYDQAAGACSLELVRDSRQETGESVPCIPLSFLLRKQGSSCAWRASGRA